MGGVNLEIFKFGLYISFPIGIMWYFGTNLDKRFSVPGFWPTPDQTYKIPHDRAEVAAELERIRERRRARKAIRLENEAKQRELDEARAKLEGVQVVREPVDVQAAKAAEEPKSAAEQKAAAEPKARGIMSYLSFGKGGS